MRKIYNKKGRKIKTMLSLAERKRKEADKEGKRGESHRPRGKLKIKNIRFKFNGNSSALVPSDNICYKQKLKL